MHLSFIADKGHAFSLAFRLLNLDRYSFTIRKTIKTLLHEKKKLSDKLLSFGINLKTLHGIDERILYTKLPNLTHATPGIEPGSSIMKYIPMK